MTEKGNDSQTKAFTWDEISYSNIIQHEALISLLLEKGIITRDEYLDKVKQVTRDLQKRQGEQ